jgi:hypothetical protein
MARFHWPHYAGQTFTLRATDEQAGDWLTAARTAGFKHTSKWIAEAADFLRHLSTLPLAWRHGRFRVVLEDGTEPEVRGWISPPFGLFHGSADGPIPHGSTQRYSLIYLPARRIVATFRTAGNYKSLASELASLLLRGELPDPVPVVERHLRESA